LAESAEYTLDQAVQAALQQRATLRGAAAQVAGAQAQVQQARSGTQPRVSVALGYTQLQDDPRFTVPSMGTLTYGQTDNRTALVELQWPLYTGGKVRGMVAQARAGVDLARAKQSREGQQVVLDVTQATLHALQAQALIGVVEQQIQTLQAHQKAVQAMLEQGVVPKIDTLRVQVAQAQAQEQLVKARNGQSLSLAALQRAMGVADVTGVQDEDVGAGLVPALPETLEVAIQQALQQRPELRQVEAQRRAARAGVQVARSGRQPTVAAFARNEWERPTYLPETGEWSVGVVLTANLWDGQQTSAAVRQAQTQVQQAEAGLEELRNGIRLQVTQAYLDVTSAEERIRTTETALASAEEAHRLADVGYRNQVTPLTDLLDAQAEWARARTDHVVALYDRRLAVAALRFAMGE
jgi:outer membrane protein TolC